MTQIAAQPITTRMTPTAVINVVGLNRAILPHMPFTRSLADRAGVTSIGHVWPAVTCSVQSTYLTGKLPFEHGIVGNGWFDRVDQEVKFWKQSNKLVNAPKVWDRARERDASFTVANMFWWYNMYSTADVSVTPRPVYPADGRKLPDIHTHPGKLRDELQTRFGQFPLFHFWGPRAGIESTRWIVNASLHVIETLRPTLALIYLPHLDYDLQRFGPHSQPAAAAAMALDAEIMRLVKGFEAQGYVSMVLSEYGIEAVSRPVHLNRELRKMGLLAIRYENGREYLDAGASAAFAVCDHQVAHVYVKDSQRIPAIAAKLAGIDGVSTVWSGDGRADIGMNCDRAGDIVVAAAERAWFTYYFWDDDALAPDYARTVDIHRKPGYDPAELFVDPAKPMMAGRIAWKLFKRRLGLRTLLDVIPLDASLVKGSHGRPPSVESAKPILIGPNLPGVVSEVAATDIHDLILRQIFS